MHARNSFKNNKVLEENYQETLKKELDFFLCGQDYEKQMGPRASY